MVNNRVALRQADGLSGFLSTMAEREMP